MANQNQCERQGRTESRTGCGEPIRGSSEELSNSLHSVLEPQDKRRENTISTEKAALLQGTGCSASADYATEKGIDPPSGKDGSLLSQDDVESIGRVIGDQRVIERGVETTG